MKKILSWLLVLSVGIFVVGCGGDDASKPIEKKDKKSADPK
jgi:hypothetical protein